MKDFSSNPLSLLKSVTSHRELLMALTKRLVIGRYKGSVFGLFWSFANPIFMLAIYTFVFSFIFKGKWDVAMEAQGSFAMILFMGLIIFNFFSECLTTSASLILSNANYVKKVVFPLEILPWVNLGNAFFHFSVSLFTWLIGSLLVFQSISIYLLLIPVILLPFIILILGLSMLVSALGVFVRDIGQFVGLLVTAMMFLTPIFYPMSRVPEEYRMAILLNPLTIPVMEMRNVLIFDRLPDWQLLSIYSVVSVIVCSVCFILFQKMRRGFADVM